MYVKTLWVFAITSVAVFMTTLDNLVVTSAISLARSSAATCRGERGFVPCGGVLAKLERRVLCRRAPVAQWIAQRFSKSSETAPMARARPWLREVGVLADSERRAAPFGGCGRGRPPMKKSLPVA
jgi:hypothetical protein